MLYQLNTRVHLHERSRTLGKAATLDDILDCDIERLAQQGFDWLWLLSVWQTGCAGRDVSRTHAEWRREFTEALPDLEEADICGSGFAITAYRVADALGGNAALGRLKQRLNDRGLRLMLDFVPNHVGLDHPWVQRHPEFLVAGSSDDLTRAPQNYYRAGTNGTHRIFAHGRDPFFPGWPDTVQLNYGSRALQQAMIRELRSIARLCDGVRCDMAMLVLPDVFERTWGVAAEPFWPRAIEAVRREDRGFVFMAETYWDLEWTLQQQGFDYTYDKRLYDRLREGHARPVREHLCAGLDFQQRSARFLENHDEPRAAAVFPRDKHQAAAVATYLAPGLGFFHQGQFEGRRTRISPHLRRGPDEPVDGATYAFYRRLLEVLRRPAVRRGAWRLLECRPAWEGNWTCDCFVASAWETGDGERLFVVVNFAPNQSQCYVRLPWDDLRGGHSRLHDLLGPATYDRDGDALAQHGLYLDMGPWQYHAFAIARRA